MNKESTIEINQLPCLTKTIKYLSNIKNCDLTKKLTLDEVQNITRVANSYLQDFIESSQFVPPQMREDFQKTICSQDYIDYFNQ